MYSFPVYRRGSILLSREEIPIQKASDIAELVRKEWQIYDQVCKEVVAENGGTAIRTNRSEQVYQPSWEVYVLHFPTVSFTVDGWRVHSRNAITVGMYTQKSEVWTRLTATAFHGKPANRLTAEKVQQYFSIAEQVGAEMVAAVTAQYLVHAKQASVSIRREPQYSLQFRAYNSRRKSCKTLQERLCDGLSLSKALKSCNFQPELLEYFAIVLGRKTSPRAVVRALRADRLDTFGLMMPEERLALFTRIINGKELDCCGHGYDTISHPSKEMLSHFSTRGLLRRYAQRV